MLEQFGLSERFVRVDEVAQSDADKAIARARRQIDAGAQSDSELGKSLFGLRRCGRRVAARDDVKIGGLELEYHGAADAIGLARRRPGFRRELADHRFDLVE